MHTPTTTPSGRPRRITPADLRGAITRRLTAQGVSAGHLARVLVVATIEPERPRYTIDPAPGATTDDSWLVRDRQGAEIGTLAICAAYERDDLGRAHHALYFDLVLPVPDGCTTHPYALCRIWSRDPWAPEPLEYHMPRPWWRRGEDSAEHLERARALLADIWLSGALTRLWRRIMEE